MKKIIIVFLSNFFLYILQFFIIPLLYTIHPSDELRNNLVLVLSSFVISIFTSLFINKFRYFIIGYLLYIILIISYHPNYLYGIGYGMFSFTSFLILKVILIVFLSQFLAWLVVNLIKKKNRVLC